MVNQNSMNTKTEIMPLVKIYQNPDGLTMWEKGYNTGVLDQNIQDTPILEQRVADAIISLLVGEAKS